MEFSAGFIMSMISSGLFIDGKLDRRPTVHSSRFDTAIGAQQPIPEEIDHCEVAVPVAVVDEMELLLSPEPRKTPKPRSRNMILIVDIVMPTE